MIDGYRRRKRRRCWRNWNEALAKQPPDAAASYHHEQNRQCDCSCKRCNYCCERKDVHNAIRKCEKHTFPLDGKSPSHCWPGQVSRAGLTSRYSTLPLCITGKAEQLLAYIHRQLLVEGHFLDKARRAVSLQGPTTTAAPWGLRREGYR